MVEGEEVGYLKAYFQPHLRSLDFKDLRIASLEHYSRFLESPFVQLAASEVSPCSS
jgi:hypothetical protein